jgi:hypothetical protein
MNGSLSQYNEVARYTFHVDSAKRNSGTNTDLYITLVQPLTRLSADGQFIVTVSSISIPFSFYQLSSTENLNVLPIYIKNAVDALGRSSSITLTPGNYTPYTLITELNARLTVACQQTGISGYTAFTPTFATTYNPQTGHITFSLTAPAGCEIQLLFSTSTVTGLLGNFFGVGQVDVVMTTSTTQTSTKPCVLNPVNYLYLRSSLKQSTRNREWVVVKDDVSDILHRIPIGTSQGTWIQFDIPSEPIYIMDLSIESINFYLTSNLTYESINLQQIDWSFSFSISEVARPKYTPIATQLAYNSFAPASPEDRQKEIDELEQRKQRELERLIRYRDKLQTADASLPEEKTPAANGAQKEGLKEPETAPSVEELVKDKSALYPTVSQMKQFQLVQYVSLWDEPTPHPIGDVLGTTLDATPQGDEDASAVADTPLTK